MKSRTIKKLRELAKALGIPGYSRMAKPDLEREVDGHEAAVTPSEASTVSVNSTPTTTLPSWQEPQAHDVATANQEERVESTKYVAAAEPPPPPITDLGEDIHTLPALAQPMLCLLPQKPGILHAYWVAPSAANNDLRLRLCRADIDGVDVHEEVALTADRGSFYFHVPESFDHESALVELGFYRGQEFVVYLSRRIRHLPTRYASDRTDQSWWIDDSDFRRQYQRAGGEVGTTRRYVWGGNTSSSLTTSAPSADAQRPVWPGNASSSS